MSPLVSLGSKCYAWRPGVSVRLDSALLLCSLPAPQTLPIQCDPLTYCGTLVAAWYYPKYLGNLVLPASERMNQTFNPEAWKAAVYQVTLKSGSYWIIAVCQVARFRGVRNRGRACSIDPRGLRETGPTLQRGARCLPPPINASVDA
jgi:hypothetical protein